MDYFESIRHLHTKEIIPIKSKLSLGKHIQTPMFDHKHRSHLHLGIFFELLSASIFGGQLVDSVSEVNGSNGCVGCKPDVKSKRTKTFIEAKAIRQGHQLNLLDEQISKYLGLQIVYPEYSIDFTIWRHGIRGVKSLDLGYIEFLKFLSENLYVGIVLPLSIIDQMHKNENGFSKRYEDNPVWYDCTRLSSSLINKFILDPLSALSQIGNKYQYTWNRYLTPKDLYIEGIQIPSFPLIIIKDKNNKWKRDLIDTVPF